MKSFTTIALMGIICMSGAACTVESVEAPARVGCGTGIPSDEDAIREAALKFLFRRHVALEPTGDRFLLKYYVGVVKTPTSQPVRPFFDPSTVIDPSPGVLTRLAANDPVVRPLSAAPHEEYASWPRTGMWDHVFITGDICWLGPDEVAIIGGSDPRFKSDTPYTMKAARAGAAWVVNSYEYKGGR